MQICPRCRYKSVVYDPSRNLYYCLWRDCGWTSLTGEEPIDRYSDEFPAAKPRRGACCANEGGDDA